jgi:putative ABC transport system permease protein
MNETVKAIPLLHLALSFLPVLLVLAVMWRWGLGYRNAVYGVLRMLLQLLLVGYVLGFIFLSGSAWIIMGVLAVMLAAASWIALREAGMTADARLVSRSLLAIALGGVPVLALVTQGVLGIDPWYAPRFMIPLAGMIFANAMNSVSLAAERLKSELNHGVEYAAARVTALQAALIPVINSLFAVGLVSLPGMMTGQILSGVEPVIAARYQIMVMCMIFGSAGISAMLFLVFIRPQAPGAQNGG